MLPSLLRTSRICLRRLQRGDAAALHAAITGTPDLDPSVDTVASVDDALAVIATYGRQFELGTRFAYGIFDDDELVGCGAIQPTDVGACNVGLWLASGARGRGIGSETVAVLAATALRSLGVERVELWCEPANHAMVRIAERAGFTHEATLRSWVRGRDQMVWRLAHVPHVELEVAHPAAGDRTWAPIRAHLHARYAVAAETERTIAIAVDVAFASGARFVQHVLVECGEVARAPWLMIRTPVAREDLLAPRSALVHAATLAIGALAIEDELYVLRHGTAPIAGAQLDTIIYMLAHEAVRLRERDVADPGAVAHAFAAFTD